ncbi:MAG TPA: hypothetical protein VJC00_04770 [Candidatus Nanoarchaeia archaeon]|nr:hypothetical protein [Candidatus Nanoarchaeia archaeon]
MPEETPEFIEQFYKKRNQVNMLLNTTEIEHSKAYIKAVDKALRNQEGNVDYELLEDDDIRQKFIDTLIGHYVSAAKSALKSDLKGETDLEKHILMKAYTGATKGALEGMIHETKSGYTKQQHDKEVGGLIKQQSKELSTLVGSHLKKEHIPHIIKYTGAGDLVDEEKMKVEHAAGLLGIYNEGKGAVTSDYVEGQIYAKEELAKKKKEKIAKKKKELGEGEAPEHPGLPKAA